MKLIELELEKALENCESSKVLDAMNYSLLAGGKRLRPLLLFETCKAYGVDETVGIPFACALEMIHTYSLIHDDLPAMDDDILRRGRNTCHVQFDEATAILAGDGLNTEAFYVISQANCCDDQKIKCIEILASCAGINGMILGQALDLNYENKEVTWEELECLHRNKTGKLFAAAFMMASVLADDKIHCNLWKEIGERLGLAFQIQDDILDITKTSQELGKSNSDVENHKATSVSLLGIEEANRVLTKHFDEVIEMINSLELKSGNLIQLLEDIRNRQM